MNTIPEMPSTFFDADFMAMFEGFTRWFISYNMPIFMLCMAALVAWIVLDMIADIPVEAKKALDRDGRRRRHDDDDDDD